MSGENTKPFQNLLCEVCGEKVNVSTGDGYWRVDPGGYIEEDRVIGDETISIDLVRPLKVLGWHMDCKFPYEEVTNEFD